MNCHRYHGAVADMPRILAAAARIPPFELSAETVAHAYGRNPTRGSRRFAAYDEDALTLAYAAANTCLKGKNTSEIRALYVASTTWPRPAAAQAERLAAALGLSDTVEVTPLGGAWQCGAAALRTALSVPHWPALVVAADRLNAPPGSEREAELGDGAAAVLIGPGEGARISEWSSHPESVEWETGDARFAAMQAARLAAAARRNECTRTAVSAPGPRAVRAATAALGGTYVDGAMECIGFCGAAHPLLALVELLETARPGECALWVAIAEGTESAIVECSAPGDRMFLAAPARPVTEYGRWLASRSFFANGTTREVFASVALETRDTDFLLRLRGTHCSVCGATHTLPAPVCDRCGGTEKLAHVPLSRTGIIFTFTHEYYVPCPIPPVTMAITDLDGGGRVLVQVADAALEEIKVGTRVQLVLRLLHMGGGRPHYYWKAIPE